MELFCLLKNVSYCDIICTRNEVLSMKKHPLDIAIFICLIIIIILLVILVWPRNEDNTKSHNDSKAKEVEKVESKDKKDKSSNTLFTDTTDASNEDEVISYVEEVEQKVKTYTQPSDYQSDFSIRETLEDTFISFTDFIFYDGTIKGVTFDELTDSAKEKILTLYEQIDSLIEKKFPNYKENISSTAKYEYTTVVSKAKELKDSIVSKYKEVVGEDAYNNVVSTFEEDKNNFQDAYSPYVEKGKEIGSQAIEKGKKILDSASSKFDSWYQEFKESRE